jgi:hydrogenase maturation protease
MSPRFERQILVAGVGNAWMLDDGFGSVVAQRLEAREMPPGVQVMDAESGGLDLASEIVRGYDALVLIDVSRQGGEPGTLQVLEPDLGAIEDGDVDAHGLDPQKVLRSVRAAGWSGKIVIVGCEPTDPADLGVGLSPALVEAVERAIGLVEETVAELRTDSAYKR